MGTLSSSGKNSSFNKPWEDLECGARSWDLFNVSEKEQIVKNYAPKVRYLALRLRAKLPKNIELNDLISAGTMGLMESLGKFDASLNIKFETYAENRIYGAMLDELRKLDWFSRGLRQRIRKIDEASWKIENEKGRQATIEELQQATGFSEKQITDGLEALQSQLFISLEAVQDTLTNGEFDNNQEPFKETALAELVDKVALLIDCLTPREKLVLSLYYVDELNMNEVAQVMEITEGRVSQLHAQAIKRLKNEFVNQYGKYDLA